MLYRKISPGFLITAVLAVFFSIHISAQEVSVDRSELQNTDGKTVEFINYVGPHDFINTAAQIRNIGHSLAKNSSYGGKYSIIHVVSPDIKEKLDADIFIIGKDAAVDHINNLRSIIAGYLEDAYGMIYEDAFLTAEFVTYYNAVYRQDIEMVKNRYKEPVVKLLDPQKIGIDTHFSNWAGKTQMIIPLRGMLQKDGSSTPVVDKGAVSDKNVVEEMRKEEDMGVENRKEMVQSIENELDKEQQNVTEQKEELQQKEEALQEDLEKISKKEQSGEELSTSEEQKKQDIQEELEQVEQEKQKLEEKQKEIDNRTEDVIEMREEIAADENKLQEEKAASAAEDKSVSEPPKPFWFYFVDKEGDGIPYGRIIKYNLNDNKVLSVSELTSVRGRGLIKNGNSILVIAGRENKNSKVHLMLLDSETLKVTKEGSDDIFPGSLIYSDGKDFYLITAENGMWKLGKFNSALSRISISEVEVNPWTSVSFEGSSVFVQGADGKVKKLSASSLKEEAVLE